MPNLKQTELDLFEEHVLSCLFGDAQNPRISGFIGTFLAFQGKTVDSVLNDSIQKFEQLALPLLDENGYVNGEKVSLILKQFTSEPVTIPNFRLIDISRQVEPLLRTIGSMIQ